MFFSISRAIKSDSRSEIFFLKGPLENTYRILAELKVEMKIQLQFGGACSPTTICSGALANALLKMQMCTSDCEFFDLAQQQKYVG